MLFRRGSLELRKGGGWGERVKSALPGSPAEGAPGQLPSSQPAPRIRSSLGGAACQLPRYYSHPHYRTVLTLKHNKLAVPLRGEETGTLFELLERAVTATGREDELTPGGRWRG